MTALASLTSNLMGYENIEKITKIAISASEHILMIGKPGTGKSLYAENMFRKLPGQFFTAQLSKWADETVLFGPPNVRTLRESGHLQYSEEGTLLGARWAFIDEIFDASDILLRTMLGILNERTFTRGSFSVKVPLQTAIAAANYTRANEMTEAVIDRFLIRVETPVLSKSQRKALWEQENPVETTKLELEDVVYLEEPTNHQADNIPLDSETIDICMEVAEKFGFSPRREVKAAKLMRHSAYLRNADKVSFEDAVNVLPYLIPISQDLTKKQEEAKKELIDTCDKVVGERSQIEYIESRKKCEGTKLDTLVNLAKNIREVRQLVPISQRVVDLQKEALLSMTAQYERFMKIMKINL